MSVMELLVVFSGVIAGVFAWIPCGISVAAHRYKLGGAVIRSTNRWVLLAVREPSSFSAIGRIAFFILLLAWLCIFFGAMVVPALVARVLGVTQSSPFIGYAIFANFAVAVVAFIAGPAIWRRVAL